MPPEEYNRNFLNDVIFKINYPPVLGLIDTPPAAFQEKITKAFPISEPLVKQGVIINSNSGNVNTQRTAKTTWRFKSKDGKKIVEVDSEYLVIGVKEYRNYSEFKELIAQLIEEFFTLYPQVVINRLGLRYVNNIVLPQKDLFDWVGYINPDLISELNFVQDKSLLRRAFHSFFLALDDDTRINIRAGFFNSVFPNEPVNKEYILDFDCFTDSQFEVDELFGKLDFYNQTITSYFENSIGDSLREFMRSR